jgi:hypothetical protein
MIRPSWRAWLLVVAACGHDAAPPKERAADLGGGIAARVGNEAIPASLVADVARVKGVTAREAMEGLVDDALAAQGGRAVGLEGDPSVGWPIVSAKARAVALRVRTDATAKGPATDAEIDEVTAQHWRQLDVPEGLRVIHAIALYPNPKKHTPEADAAVRVTADRLAAAVAKATTPAEFESLAHAVVPENKVSTRVETLVFAVDGRSLDSNAVYQPSFVAPTAALHAPGDKVRAESTFGLHVVQLVERLPAHRVPLSERRTMLEADAITFRARKAYEVLLTDLQQRYPVEISTAADQLMQTVSVAQP